MFAIITFCMHCILSTEIEVIEQCYKDLAEAIISDVMYYSGQFIECGFIPHTSAQFICEALGKNEGEKAVALLDVVIHHVKNAEHKKEAFERFVNIFSSDRHNNVAQNMTEKYSKYTVCVSMII